jgi:lipoprotein-anchoring transpeptidase ErfK/SrfK
MTHQPSAPTPFNRRGFLKFAFAGLGGLILHQPWRITAQQTPFPDSPRLGRVFTKVDVKAKPAYDSETVAVLYDDAVVPWLHEISGNHPHRFRQRWVEIDRGYIWSSDLQPTRNLPNQPVLELPQTSLGTGMWTEVTIPFVDLVLANPPARSPWVKYRLENKLPLRLYYSQILWVDQTKTDDQGQTWYRVNERFAYGDIFWAKAQAFRPLTADEVAPISPEVENKRVLVNVYEKFQTLSCYEGNREVFHAIVTAGKRFDPDGNPLDRSSTPIGKHYIWRKMISTHMSGGTTGGGYDLPGIGWTTLFVGSGVALHSTYWHNNFGGELMSHGCVNMRPEDAKWVFRWTSPIVTYDPGDVTISGLTATPIQVIEE